MPDNSLEERVFAIEQMLRDYPTRLDLERLEAALGQQILQLRVEMSGELSAVQDRIRTGDEETRRTLREEIRAGDEETRRILRDEIRAVDDSLRGLIEQRTAEILVVVHAGDEETRRLMRVLHEEVIARIETIARG